MLIADCIIVSLALNHDLDGRFYNITDSFCNNNKIYYMHFSLLLIHRVCFVIMLTILTIILLYGLYN